MSHLIISKKNEIYLQIQAEPHIYYELRDAFQFDVPNARFSPAYRNKWWDGIIYLFNVNTKEIYIGLLDRIIQFCDDHKYTYEFKENKYYGLPFEVNENISKEGVHDYMNSITRYTPRDYQIDAVYQSLKYNRRVILSPTSSGKSLQIYSLIRYYKDKNENILIITPRTSLVSQLYKDFIDYGWDAENYCHLIMSGTEKDCDKPVYISTWQSLYKMPKSYFQKFGCVIVDECFSGDMRVLTPDGYMKIKDLKEGDLVINYDEEREIFKEDVIVNTHKNLNNTSLEKMYKLEFDNGNIIECTGNHKFLTDKGWVRADDLTDEHEIINIKYPEIH